MEMTNIYIYGTIGALLFLVIGVMLGYARKESQQMYANAIQRQHLHSLDEAWRNRVTNAETLAAVNERNYKFADKYRAVLVKAMTDLGIWDFAKHGDNPGMMLAIMVLHVADQAIDPTINQKAKNLHTAGVRKGAKKGREQMRKLMQKSIDNQADTITKLYVMYDNSIDRTNRIKEAVTNVLNDKVALPGVRKSIRNGINVECERLRLVAAKKGA